MENIKLDEYCDNIIKLCDNLCYSLKIVKNDFNSIKFLGQIYDRENYLYIMNEYHEILDKIILLSIRSRKLGGKISNYIDSELDQINSYITDYFNHCCDILNNIILLCDNMERFIGTFSKYNFTPSLLFFAINLILTYNSILSHINTLRENSNKLVLLFDRKNKITIFDYISYLRSNKDKINDLMVINHKFYLTL